MWETYKSSGSLYTVSQSCRVTDGLEAELVFKQGSKTSTEHDAKCSILGTGALDWSILANRHIPHTENPGSSMQRQFER